MAEDIKYELDIMAAFSRLGYSPRGEQVRYIDIILQSYLDEGKTSVILSAPTGTGKSIIGAVVAEVLHEKTCPGRKSLASFILMQNNALTKQYSDSFENINGFALIKGAASYPCNALMVGNSEPDANAESCAYKAFRDKNVVDMLELCKGCEYKQTRSQINRCKHLISNYSYYFICQLYAGNLEYRTVTVWDEAHTLNDIFVEHFAVHFSAKRLRAFSKEIASNISDMNIQFFQDIKTIVEEIEANQITDQNYRDYLNRLMDLYHVASSMASKEADISNLSQYSKLMKLHKKYEGLYCKIDDFIKFDYPHVFDKKEEENEITIKPIFVGDMFEPLMNSKYQLFMSATISDKFLIETLNLDKSTTKFIKLPPSFPKKNKMVVFLPSISMNYKTMKEQSTKNRILEEVEGVVLSHVERGERGIVLTPSFDLTEMIAVRLRLHDKHFRLFEHVRGMKITDLLPDFKADDEPGVLVSPSLFEGIDLPGDISRFQILVKAPYASLGDKRMKYIVEKHPQVYEFITVLKVIQGCGRSVRSPEDKATTYMIDSNLKRLWFSSTNVWRNEFHTVTL